MYIRVEGDVTTPPLSNDTEGAAFGVPDVQVSPHPAQVSLRLYGALYESVFNTLTVYRLRLVTFPMESN